MNLYQKMKIILIFLVIAYASITAASAGGTFTDLNTAIEQADGTVIFSMDYKYDSITDTLFQDGIVIAKDLIIDGQGYEIDADNKAGIFRISPDVTVVLKNITFANGYKQFENGGAVSSEGNITVEECTFINNYAFRGGALFASSSGALNIDNSTFEKNEAIQGGAILTEGDLTVTRSYFEKNQANFGGSGIRVFGNSTVTECVFENNTVGYDGTIFADKNLTVSGSVFKNNTAAGNGSAICLTSDSISITGSLFQNNTAPNGSIFMNIENDSFLNYNIILDSGNVVNNNGSKEINVDFNWWGDNNDPALKAAGPIEINNYYTMSLASIDSPKYKTEFEYKYIFGLNDDEKHDSKLLPKFTADIKYNTNLVDSIDGRYNKTLTVAIDKIGDNKIEIYSFDTSIAFLTFEIKNTIDLNVEFSENVGEQIEITIKAIDQDGVPIAGEVKLYANEILIGTVNLVNGAGSYSYTPTEVGTVTIKAKFEENENYSAAEIEENLVIKSHSAGSSSDKKTSTKLDIVENVTSAPPASELPLSEQTVSELPLSEQAVSEPPVSSVSELLKSMNNIQTGLVLMAVLLGSVFAFGLYRKK